MEPWTTARYRHPRLAPDVEIRAAGNAIELARGAERKSIRLEAPDAASGMALELESLRDPASAIWARIGSDEPDDGWQTLMTHLDAWAFIDDAEEDVAPLLERPLAEADRCVAQAVAHVRSRLSLEGLDAVSAEARRWLDLVATDGPSADDAWIDDNFYRAVGRLSIARLRSSHPIAFERVLDVLAEVGGCRSLGAPGIAFTGAAYSVPEMWSHLSAISDLLVGSVRNGAARRCRPSPERATALTGTGFVKLTETAMRGHAAQLGTGEFELAWSALDAADCPLAIGCHVEEYHVTRRFVEMITPLMASDLEPRLRELVYRYFSEEVGHESFERATCATFGVDAATLDAACPLPLHVAFVDVFTMLARRGPIDFLSAVAITEGMLGERSPLNERMDELMPVDAEAKSIYHKHEELNLGLNHASIPRLALSLVPVVDVAEQRRALQSLALVFELNFRAWEGLLEFYGDQAELRLPRPFDDGLAHQGRPALA